MKEIKLKPCPFCGSEAKKVEEHDNFRFTTLVYIRCTKCFAMTPISDKFSEWFDEEYLIERWNRRADNETD